MFRRSDWVTVDLDVFPSLYLHDSDGKIVTKTPADIQTLGQRFVGIVTEVQPNGYLTIHLVEKVTGFTIGEVAVPPDKVQLLEDKRGVPADRLSTYSEDWMPRGLRIKRANPVERPGKLVPGNS